MIITPKVKTWIAITWIFALGYIVSSFCDIFPAFVSTLLTLVMAVVLVTCTYLIFGRSIDQIDPKP